MDPTALRESIPALESGVYCNWGAAGPSPRQVVEAAESTLEHHEYDAPTAEGPYTAAFDVYDETRDAVARFLGATPDEIALTESTTDGINRVAGAIDWEEGDVVVRTDLEHAAGILPWQRLEREYGVDVRVLETSVASEAQRADGDSAERSRGNSEMSRPSGDEVSRDSAHHSSGQRPREEAVDEAGRLDLEDLTAVVDDARLVCLSSLTWTHGTRLPVADVVDIAHEAGALVLVDAVQGPGQVPIDVGAWGADFVAGAGHKWLLGPFGSGFLYVRDGVTREHDLVPQAIGYRSVEDENAAVYQLEPGARRFEVATSSPAPYAGLVAAIELVEDVGLGTIGRRIESLTDRLKDGIPDEQLLSPREFESGLVTIADGDPEATVERLAEEGIVVRSLPRPEAVRVSVHAVNTAAEVDRVLEEL